ncbi:Uncharacterized protein ToN1_14740 [Aromatoleum petrolei]|nr:Uncharacterized protein ToN1_14740 [Aromatoleum petrolei]
MRRKAMRGGMAGGASFPDAVSVSAANCAGAPIGLQFS